VSSARQKDAVAAIVAGMLTFVAIKFGTSGAGWLNANLWGLLGSLAGFTASLMSTGATSRQAPS
jgi:hypothetical protein